VNETIELQEMALEHLFAEPLFGLAFAEHVQFPHGIGPPPSTFFCHSSPRLYCLQPVPQFLGSHTPVMGSMSLSSATITSDGSKSSRKVGDWVASRTCVWDDAARISPEINQHGVGMQAQLRFVHEDQVRQFALGLQKDRDECNRPQGAVRELVGAKQVIPSKLPPIQKDVPGIQLPGLQHKIIEGRHDLPHRGPDTAVDVFVGPLVAVQNGRQVAAVGV
jgi:hypothetical protein